MIKGKQVVVTAASGPNAEALDRTFTSFAQNPFLELHAFVFGQKLPEMRLPQINYRLVAPDPAFSDPMRDQYYRRWILLDELDAEYALVVDNGDVLCLQPMPEIPSLLHGAAMGGCVEHAGGRYLMGQEYVSCYLNTGVTFWNVPSSRKIREETMARGRARFRSIDDQRSINEIVHSRYYDQLVLLPCQYNYRAFLPPKRSSRWPTVTHLDGVVIYHNSHCIDAAKKLLPVKRRAELPDLPQDPAPLTPRQQFWRKVRERLKPHIVGSGFLRRLISGN
ncbi:MAG: hypothetical protein ABSA69_06795 [Verrucomicrobiota bacterium]|jgi:hypothetical protein